MNKYFRTILVCGINAAACHFGFAVAQGVGEQDSSVHRGKLVEFDAPGAATSDGYVASVDAPDAGSGAGQGTRPSTNNAQDEVTDTTTGVLAPIAGLVGRFRFI